MTDQSNFQVQMSELEATKFALRELLVIRESINNRRKETFHLKRVDRKMLKAYRSISRQTISLAARLANLGLGSSEVAAIIAEAKAEAAKL